MRGLEAIPGGAFALAVCRTLPGEFFSRRYVGPLFFGRPLLWDHKSAHKRVPARRGVVPAGLFQSYVGLASNVWACFIFHSRFTL